MKRNQHGRWLPAEKLEVVRAYQQGVSIHDLQSLFHLSSFTIYAWVQAYQKNGTDGLESATRARPRELRPKTAIAQEIISQIPRDQTPSVGKTRGHLYRYEFIRLARDTVRKLLRRDGRPPLPSRPVHRNMPVRVRHFEMSKPNQLWQTDIMTFMLKGQYRVYVIAFIDDYSRFIVGWGLVRFQTSAHVVEVFRAAIEKYGMPKEVLSDNGRQYYTWRGMSQFSKILQKLGIRHVRSRPYHPQTLGKIERFWRNLLQECLTRTPLSSFEEAESKIREYVEYYNFKRPHQGIGDVVPSDRFFSVDGQVRQIVEESLAARGPKPALPRRPHDRRTRILASDVMRSSDSVDLGGGRKLIVTLDECSLFKVGWDLAAEETAEAVADHARAIVRRTKRLPLVWKFDHGSGFMNREFQSILRDHEIVPYPTTCRAPWTNGRSEREHREILNWVRSAPEDALFFRDVDEGMRMLNFVKPRAVLGFRTSAQAYFDGRRRRPFDRGDFTKNASSSWALRTKSSTSLAPGILRWNKMELPIVCIVAVRARAGLDIMCHPWHTKKEFAGGCVRS